MKRRVLFLLLIIVGILTSCTSSSTPPSPPKDPLQNVIDNLSSLNEYSSLEAVSNVENLYNALSDDQKKSVTNYEKILYYKECANFRHRLNSAFPAAEEILKLNLKNPQSLQVHSCNTYRAYTSNPNAGNDRRIDYIIVYIETPNGEIVRYIEREKFDIWCI